MQTLKITEDGRLVELKREDNIPMYYILYRHVEGNPKQLLNAGEYNVSESMIVDEYEGLDWHTQEDFIKSSDWWLIKGINFDSFVKHVHATLPVGEVIFTLIATINYHNYLTEEEAKEWGVE